MLIGLGFPEDTPPRAAVMATPLTREESRRIGKLYAENIKLVTYFTSKLRGKFGHCMATEDIRSCVDMGFIKAARQWDEAKGKLSTIFYVFALGECTHWMRENWTVAAPYKMRILGAKVRQIIDNGGTIEDAQEKLGASVDDIKDALLATAGVAHETNDWQLHACPRPTPWEVLLASEAT
jgi:DNA-directed RNA polymerase specialized sigma subunit